MISNGHREQFISEFANCTTDEERFECAETHLELAHEDGAEEATERAEEAAYRNGGELPDLSEDLAWLRTRIERGDKIDALKLVDEIEAAL